MKKRLIRSAMFTTNHDGQHWYFTAIDHNLIKFRF